MSERNKSAVYFLKFEDGGYVVHHLLGSPLVFESALAAQHYADARYDKVGRFPQVVMGVIPEAMETIE